MFTVVSHCQIMEQLGSKDSSCNLYVNCAISFFILPTFNTPYMCVQACKVTFLAKILLNLNNANWNYSSWETDSCGCRIAGKYASREGTQSPHKGRDNEAAIR